MDLETAEAAYSAISALGFPFVLFLLVLGSYYEIYYWGKSCRAERAIWAAREVKLEAAVDRIQEAAAAREAAQQERIDQLLDKMLEGAVLLREGARQVSRR